MNPATDVEQRAALERFAQLTTEEKADVLARGRLIQTIEDLAYLSEADADRLRPIIEAQTATP